MTQLDKFYTNVDVARKCVTTVGEKFGWDWDMIIEPSAGNGSFLLLIPSVNKIGIDIEPEHEDILKLDFLGYNPPRGAKRVLVIGNPPFGRVSSLAIKFFNHAAEWAHVIAFILPRTFRRKSVQNKLAREFHLLHDEDIPLKPCAFTPPMMAKCCFQIWDRREHQREMHLLETTHPDWDFLPFGPKDARGQPTPPTGAHFAVRAAGGRCGEVKVDNLHLLRPKSWHWLRANIDPTVLKARIESLDFSLSQDTARQNSIGRGELVGLYSDTYRPDTYEQS